MQRPFKFTKLKLITGYILILLLGAIAIVFIYKQTIALTQKGMMKSLCNKNYSS